MNRSRSDWFAQMQTNPQFAAALETEFSRQAADIRSAASAVGGRALLVGDSITAQSSDLTIKLWHPQVRMWDPNQ